MRKQLFFVMLMALGLVGCGKGTEPTTPQASQTAMSGDANYSTPADATQPSNDLNNSIAPAPMTGNETTGVNNTNSSSDNTNIDEN